MLRVENLRVMAEDRLVLKGVSFTVERGETVALFGPNGSGKTSLLCAILGFPNYKVTGGRILFKGRDVTGLRVDERARLGMGMAYQRPPSVRGVRLGDLVSLCGKIHGGMEASARLLERLHLGALAGRDLNLGFSGGEIRRSELALLYAQSPDLLLFDEPDSGVDLVSIGLVASVMNELLQKATPSRDRSRAGLVITHTGHILDLVHADRAFVLVDGAITCTGDAPALLEDIRSVGYEGCAACRRAG